MKLNTLIINHLQNIATQYCNYFNFTFGNVQKSFVYSHSDNNKTTTMKTLKQTLLFAFALYSFGSALALCTLVNDANLFGALAIIFLCIISGIISFNTLLTSK